jgi:hypothetical protein
LLIFRPKVTSFLALTSPKNPVSGGRYPTSGITIYFPTKTSLIYFANHRKLKLSSRMTTYFQFGFVFEAELSAPPVSPVLRANQRSSNPIPY